ncbi:PHD finger protein 3 [Collichthys lucidus]|uniref:PHD finger protein 3 n=1 Tax=Collichthys lucidus TaxID=240159 RepID=A0A4U5VC37_COLLU|nr:PHD finger protein 3 [Collichthys lucidus]
MAESFSSGMKNEDQEKNSKTSAVVVVHGGAWAIPDELAKASVDGVKVAACEGYSVLKRGGSALDAVEAAVRTMEDNTVFNAGHGAALNADGEVELDAIIMDGRTLGSGAVSSVKNIANPVTLARAVMEKTAHVMLTSRGANLFAESIGTVTVPTDTLVTEYEREEWDKHKNYVTGVMEDFNSQWKAAAAFMDIVDTFNHLIPSDQLDESLIIGQNLECEAGNEFGTGLRLEDSLKNMLSDKDPMFGCASSQFNLLDNEDAAFPIADSTVLADGSASTGLSNELTVEENTEVKRPVGRQKKHPRTLESGKFMVGCGRCDDWFHGDCVGLDLTKVREMEEEDQMYVCLKCCEEESKKVEPEPPSAAKPEVQTKIEVPDQKLPPKPRPGPSQTLTSGGARPVLFKRVLKGEISPSNLIRMSPEELASKELAAWRQRENRHTIEMIEKEQREVERRPITKITHKGEIEIESQEPVKAPEPVELEPPPKVTEVSAEPPKTPKKTEESTKTEKDTTHQHKSHLFDLNCKICTGRMAPPVEEAPTKVVKVATTVVRRQSTKAEETKSTTPPAMEDDLHLTVLEESFRNAKSGYEGRLDHTAGRDDETAFLSNLKSLWGGLIHMHAVAKFMTKAFPVSGVLDNLTEDLPDSVQVGGRISPQIVWDYLEKIRATGTKEVCLIRFSPETEEDEISYTLLYAYFSSRKRFGVVSNNLKQVKDMYLIPLGATEKVPHQLVPFDGPGLENNRANLLLGLIIRQRPKRDFLPVDMNETARIIPEIKPITVSTKETRVTEEDEKFFLPSLPPAHIKEKEKPLNTTEDAEQITEAFEEPSASEETNNQEPQKPLRFLPGVLVGWGGELPPLPDVGAKPATAADDTQKTQTAPQTETSTGNTKSPTAAAPRERFVIKKKEAKPVKAEPELSSPTNTSAANNPSSKDAVVVTHGAPVSLKDKPPDVSTEAFLQQQPQVPGSYDYSTGPHTQDQNQSTTWVQDSTSHTLPGLQSQFTESYSETPGRPPSLVKDTKRVEERYSDPWERSRNTEDRDHQGRHSHHRDSHHGKKSRHHDREREKKHDRSYDDKYRERSRYHGHSEDRYGEKRKERQYSDDYSSRHKDRHRHRRDSDYENGRRSSKDSYS